MWANHDVKKNYWNVHKYGNDESLLWDASVDWKNFKIIVDRVINQYFAKGNYFKINGAPVFSIFGLEKFVQSFGTVDEARKALDYFRKEVKRYGFPELHIQSIIGGGMPDEKMLQQIEQLGINSMTHYNWGGPHPEDYMTWGKESMERMDKWVEALSVPYFPNASVGWDDTPRFPHKTQKDVVHYNNSPQSFATYLQKAKEYLDAAMKEMGVSNPADIKITLLTTDTDGAKKQAEVLQEQYQKNLGIKVEINQVTYKQRLQMETEKDYDMVVTGWVPDYSDAYSYLELWISDGQYNHSGYANAEYDKLLKDSQTETDAKTRQDMLFQAEKIFLEEDSALVPLQLRRDQYLINPKISNFNVYFVGYDFDLVYADISE